MIAKILSISDVITNSSSEVFIIHAKPEFQDEINKEVPEIIKNLCEILELNINEILEFKIAEGSYIDINWDYHVAKNDLLIYSVDDNTIPYWLMEFISSLYNFPKFKEKFSGYYAKDLGEIELPYYDWNEPDYKKRNKLRKTEVESIHREHLG